MPLVTEMGEVKEKKKKIFLWPESNRGGTGHWFLGTNQPTNLGLLRYEASVYPIAIAPF